MIRPARRYCQIRRRDVRLTLPKLIYTVYRLDTSTLVLESSSLPITMDRLSPHPPITPLSPPPHSLRRGAHYRGESKEGIPSSSSSCTSVGELHFGPWFYGPPGGDLDNASHAHLLPQAISTTPPPSPSPHSSRPHMETNKYKPTLTVQSSVLDLFGQANTEATHPTGTSSMNDIVDSHSPATHRRVPWLVVQDGPPGVAKGLRHGW